LSDLTDINIGHYRNSADYEDSIWYAGQAQPWMSGVDENHIQLINDNKIYSGSRQLMPVPAGESFGYASAPPNPLVRQAMLDKVELAKALGARFIQPGGVAKTATQAAGEMKVANSILSLISANVSEAYVKSIGFVGAYMGVDSTGVVFELNNHFVPEGATAQDIQQKVNAWLTGAIGLADHLNNMKNIGLVSQDKTIEEFSEEVGNNAEGI
jgi:hypothetical protein